MTHMSAIPRSMGPLKNLQWLHTNWKRENFRNTYGYFPSKTFSFLQQKVLVFLHKICCNFTLEINLKRDQTNFFKNLNFLNYIYCVFWKVNRCSASQNQFFWHFRIFFCQKWEKEEDSMQKGKKYTFQIAIRAIWSHQN